MPRVAIKKVEYMVKDLSNYIRGEMKSQKVTQKEMGTLTHLSQQSFGKHLAKCDFTAYQLIKIFRRLDTPDELVLKYMKGE